MSAPRGVERLLNVIMTIGSRRRITRETLFSVIPEYASATSQVAAERMFERDKRDILDLGLALETEIDPWDESVVHYRIVRDGGRLPDLDVTPAEYTVLLAASRAWDDTAAGGAARRVRAKLLSLGQQTDDELVRRTPRGTIESLPVLTPLLEAVTTQRQVTFRYRAATGQISERHLEPWVVGVHVGHWYVLGHDLDRDEPRVFRASRIESFPKTRGTRTRPVPADVSLDAAFDRAGSWSDETADAVFAVEPYKALPLRDAAGADVAAPRVTRLGISRPAARRTVLGSSRWVALVSPATWREEIRSVLDLVATLHEGPADIDVIETAPVRQRAAIRSSTSSTDHLSRLIGEAAYVLARGEARLEDMADEFGITVERLIDDLQILFVCGDLGTGWEDFIEAEWDSGWVRVRNADALGGPLRLTPAEATALLAGLGALEPASGAEHDLVASARAKLVALLGGTDGAASTGRPAADGISTSPDSASPNATSPDSARPDPEPPAPPARIDQVVTGIQDALTDSAPIVIRYSPPDRPGTSVRRLAPRRLESRSGRAYLRAHDLTVDEERTFRLDRIVELLDDAPSEGTEPTAPTAPTATTAPPTQVSARTAQRRSAAGPVWVRLEAAGAWIAEAFEAAQLREPADGSGVLARLDAPVTAALVDAVIEAAGAAEVLAPPDLRDQIVTVARRARDAHDPVEPIG